MKLTIIITGLEPNGAETMLLKVLTHIDRQQFSPNVISLTTVGEIGIRIQALGISVEALGMKPGFPSPFALWQLSRRLNAIQPDVIHTMMYHANLLGTAAARMAGISAISWSIHHSNLSRRANKRTTLAVVAAGARLSHWLPISILSCSEFARKVHVNYGYSGEKMVVIPNGFEVSRFKPDAAARVAVRQELGVDADTPLVGLIGRFNPQKNHAGFFDAARLLHRSIPTVHFVLAGPGIVQENRELMRAVEAADVMGVTHLLGPRNDLPLLMAALNVLASSSIGEAFPNVLGEAMACGVPCAVTDVGDSAYIVGDTGRVVASEDMVALATAMEYLLSLRPEEQRMIEKRVRKRVIDHFEIRKVTKLYEEFYLMTLLLSKKRNR